jgi:Zn-dependent metalloprotease
MQHGRLRRVHLLLLGALVVWPTGVASAATVASPGLQASSDATGKVRFMSAQPGHVLASASAAPAGSSAAKVGDDFLQRRAPAFGLTGSDLRVERTTPQPQGGTAVRYQQTIDGIPVFGGELIVHLDAAGDVVSAVGEAGPDTGVATTPTVSLIDAQAAAVASVAAATHLVPAGLTATDDGLRIYDPRLMGGTRSGEPVLVRAVQVSGGLTVRKLVLVDARGGEVVTTIEEVLSDRSRWVCDAEEHADRQVPCTDPLLTEGDQYTGSLADVTDAYNYAGATYDYYVAHFARDSVDGHGLRLLSTIRGCMDEDDCPMANAFWNGQQMVYGDGYAHADDIVGHELTHGVTQLTSHLVYQGESGAINESLSDIFGELVDQATETPDDAPTDRWQFGESLSGGAMRDMADPPAHDQPDRMDSPLFTNTSDDYDSGGVHTNSGVGNKTAYLIAAGGDFGGEIVTGLGNDKMAQIFYAVQTSYLTSASDYADLGTDLPQACEGLVGTHDITLDDCQQVRKAVHATGIAPVARMVLPPEGIRARKPFTASSDGSQGSAQPITSDAWSFSDGGASSGATATHTFADDGPAWVQLTVTDHKGGSSTVRQSVDVRRADSAFLDLPGCTDYALGANDDGSTGRVDLPFTADFYGDRYQSLFVNNNGNVTFDGPLGTYTPFGLSTTAHAIIAPFFADVDTRGGVDLVHYGSTTYAGRQAFCVNWDGVAGLGYFRAKTDKLDRFQLVLVDRSDVDDGDFDVYFNYDQVQWEAGEASGGVDGLGGAAARAGYANGSQEDGTTFEIPGAATPGAYLDGSTGSLVSGSRNSTARGRWIFPVRRGNPPSSGRIHGRVLGPDPVEGSLVQVCRDATESCVVSRTSSDGTFSAVGLDAGDYAVRATPPVLDFVHAPGVVTDVHVAARADVDQDVRLTPLNGGPPSSTTITSDRTMPDGTPVLPWGIDVELTTLGCPGGTAHFTMSRDGDVVREGAMPEVAGHPGLFVGSTHPLAPMIGAIAVQVAVSGCHDGTQDKTVAFSAYIDPSGVVVTTDGDPVPDVKVTLLRADASSGPFTLVPDGSDIMAPSNRTNPDRTNADGRFGWDVIAGYYQVTAEHVGCRAADGSGSVATTDILTIPPPALDLKLTLVCDSGAAAPAAADLGEEAVGAAGAPQEIALTNTGLGRLRVSSATVGGDDAADFAVTANDCADPVKPHAACHVAVAFTPHAVGIRHATLTFADDAADHGTQVVALSGTGRNDGSDSAPSAVAPSAVMPSAVMPSAVAPSAVAPTPHASAPVRATSQAKSKKAKAKSPCAGKHGKALKRCRVVQRRKAALARCQKVKQAKARMRCRAKARKIR